MHPVAARIPPIAPAPSDRAETWTGERRGADRVVLDGTQPNDDEPRVADRTGGADEARRGRRA